MAEFLKCALGAGFMLGCSATYACAGPHWQWAVAGFYAHDQNASAKVQLTYAPNQVLEAEGFRVRYEGRLSGWDDHYVFAPRSYVIEAEDSFYIGTGIHRGPWRMQVYGGATVFSDTQFGLSTEFGASAIAEVLWLGNAGEFAGFEVRGSTIKNNWSASFISGRPTGFGNLKLGPEAGVSGNVTGWNTRLGLAVTGLSLANYDLALGFGALVDDQSDVSPYVSIYLSGKF